MSDERWQQEIEEHRMQAILAVLRRVQEKCGDGTAFYLALELGLKDEYRKHVMKEAA